MNRRVVVTGIGIVSPFGIGVDTFWPSLLSGKCGIQPITRFDAGGFPCQIAAELPPYQIADYVPKSYRKATKLMARDIELAVIAADDAFKHAGLMSRACSGQPQIESTRFGCSIGAGLISVDLNELTAAMVHAENPDHTLDLSRWGAGEMNRLTPLWLLKYLPNMLSCHVTIIHGLEGPSNTIAAGEASSHLAIGEAYRTIQRGAADLMICGGAETKVHPMGLLRQTLLNRLTDRHNDSPAEAVRPFDPEASGTVTGEGGGLLVLEELEHARQRGATIYAEVVGFGAGQDASPLPDPDPQAVGYQHAITSALNDASLSPDDLDLMIPSGTGIPSFDRAEPAAMQHSFGARLSTLPLAPMKGQIGNLAAGSGVEAAAAVLALHHHILPPAMNAAHTFNGAKLNTVPACREGNIQTAMSTAWSHGGQSAALVFRNLE